MMANDITLLLEQQRVDGGDFDVLLQQSNRALDVGDLATANRYGDLAEQVMDRIRKRSRILAGLVEYV